MPRTSSVCSLASASKGQLRSTIVPTVRCGSYPFSAKAWQVQAKSCSGLGRGPAGYDRVIFRRCADSGQAIVFWLYEQRVQAGMNINIWDIAEDIERLIQSARPINADDLAHPTIPLTNLL